MSILVDSSTRLIVQGITGREGSFHTKRMLEYGTNVVAGVTPGKGGQTVEGVSVFNSVEEAVKETQANAAVLFVPPQRTLDAILEQVAAGVKLVITIAEGVPVKDMRTLYHINRAHKDLAIIGPNSFGVISPGKAKAGFMDHRIYSEGPVGLMSRSATNSYETVNEMTKSGIGQSTCVGVGGDVIPGTSFVKLLPMFEEDEQTKAIVLIGEIGGTDEETAASYIKNHMKKPVIAYIAGRHAPKGKVMGHAGAIVGADGAGSAESKIDILTAAGVRIADSPVQIVELLEQVL
ncbi:succinate--CoA ligase subunit alpha [Sporomusa aerivorans]|uniref:succinate--CoA ligase subunit alpha n=1 Tax=Sporomusa aerivorans TaxID=204936 RepID=UPI00352B7DB7